MGRRFVKTNPGRYVSFPGAGPPQWQVPHEEVVTRGVYKGDPGGGAAQWQSPSRYSYYVSYSTGNNANPGTEALPFQTPSAIPALTAGQSVGFKRGDTWPAAALPFTLPVGNGTAKSRITYGAYGTGAKPIFDGELSLTAIISGLNRTYITLQDLKVINQQDLASRRSIELGSSTTTSRHDVHLIRVETEDTINGGDDGVYCSRLVDLYCYDCDFTGSENHLAFHPDTIGAVTLNAVKCRFTSSGNSSVGTGTNGGLTATFSECTWTDCLRVFSGTLAGDSAVISRSRVIAQNNTRQCQVDGPNVRFTYCLIDARQSVTANTVLNTGPSGSGTTYENCTFLGDAGAGSQRGAIYSENGTGVVTLTNCVFDRWWRIGISSTGTVNSSYCYIDTIGAGAENLDTEVNNLTEANFAEGVDGTTGRPSSNLTGGNKGINLGRGALTDLAGVSVDESSPTRGCYETTA